MTGAKGGNALTSFFPLCSCFPLAEPNQWHLAKEPEWDSHKGQPAGTQSRPERRGRKSSMGIGNDWHNVCVSVKLGKKGVRMCVYTHHTHYIHTIYIYNMLFL